MVGNVPALTSPVVNTSGSAVDVEGQTLYIPLEFWFCRNPGLALPLIALQYHEVKINLEFREKSECYWAADATGAVISTTTDLTKATIGSLSSASLFVDYIYLDTDERRRFAQVSHEYLIEQLQFTGDESTSNVNNKVKLNFNHPVKELVWVVQKDAHVADTTTGDVYGKQWFNYTDDKDYTYVATGSASASGAFGSNVALVNPATALNGDAGSMPGVAAGGANNVYVPVSFENGTNPVSLAKLQLNGHDRFSERDGRYFNLVQPYQHHENVPSAGINVYSFGLKPEEHQPSGTCNMSRIDNATLNLTLTAKTVASSATAKIRVYAVNYNVLRIMSGLPFKARKSYTRCISWKKCIEKRLSIQGRLDKICKLVTSRCFLFKTSARYLDDRESLKTMYTKVDSERIYRPREKNLGMVKYTWMTEVYLPEMGNSQAYDLNSKTAEHGQASETERVSVSDEGLAILNSLKIQSGPLGNLKGHTDGWPRFIE